MRSRTGTLSFGLFVIVVLGAIFWMLHQQGRPNWGLIAVLAGILLLRVVLFLVNMRQQRHNAEAGSGPVKIETRLGLNDETPDAGGSAPSGPSQSQSQSQDAPRP